jgi:hypothetical protein
MRSTDSVEPVNVLSDGELIGVGLVERAALEGEDGVGQAVDRAARQLVGALSEHQVRV